MPGGITYLDPLLEELLRELRLLRDFLRPRLRDRDDSEELAKQKQISTFFNSLVNFQ
jgi:hypothetical protein